MINGLFKIWTHFWKWLNHLPKQSIAIVCTGCAIIASMGFAIYLLQDIDRNTNSEPVMSELTAIRAEFARNDSMMIKEIRTLSALVDDVDGKVTKVILIVAANSNSDLIRRIVPYLENVATKQDIYGFILDMQRSEQQQQQQQKDSIKYSISAEKKTK